MIHTTHPMIAVTGSLTHNHSDAPVCQVGQAYIDAIQNAGGLPLVVPVGLNITGLAALINRLDGLMLTGGGDIDPARFNGKPHPRVYGVCPERDALELSLIHI